MNVWVNYPLIAWNNPLNVNALSLKTLCLSFDRFGHKKILKMSGGVYGGGKLCCLIAEKIITLSTVSVHLEWSVVVVR